MANPTPPNNAAPEGAEVKTVNPASTIESSTVPSDTKPAADTGKARSDISLRSPRKYGIKEEGEAWVPPPLEWLEGTWAVTHSTLPMWRKAKNVRITYKILAASTPGGEACLDDCVENEPTERTLLPQPKSIRGVDTPDGEGAWAWRGKGLLRIASSRWEVLGWGERDGERWVVTWFAPSLFTPAGVDVYSGRREGISEGLFEVVEKALEGLRAREVAELCKNEMRAVKIEY